MRVSPDPIKSYPFWIKPFFWLQKKNYGQVLTPGLLWGKVPLLFATVASLYGVINRKRSPIDAVLRSLITVRVSQINHCQFCIDINSMTLAKRAGSEDKVMALKDWRNHTIFNNQERAVLDYTESMSDNSKSVTNQQVELLKTWFDEKAIVDLTGLIAFQNMSAKFNAALDVPAQGFCHIRPPEQNDEDK
ncbi:carboxymuconolactone decarboxylase family protein [Motilimonas sp. 1_MG-2023]|uniref:carboxymuconolactone decarboxylase family protein n=1 Tax=Motilimonas sp. 1_MG-2023 TaxID=3062672 RepID=UPI0026E2D35E|nr:carboxymuconolactone decarboxylase family protein [Motilimonas sp. 1_MG-2023]MDO6526554.1 carboxymuconolactone decarboxylase family protein [Motilimonas sp. 1_MG-2023]